MRKKNPFEYGSGLSADALVDREQGIAEVVSTVDEGGKLLVAVSPANPDGAIHRG